MSTTKRVTIPPAVHAMSLLEICAELRADRLGLEQALTVLADRPSLEPSWRSGDAIAGAVAIPKAATLTNACPTCGRASGDLAAPGDVPAKGNRCP